MVAPSRGLPRDRTTLLATDRDRSALAAFDAEPQRRWVRSVGRVSLLTAVQEVQLARRIERGTRAQARLARGGLTQRRREQAEALVQDGREARSHLVDANSRLVADIALKYQGRGVEVDDLLQEGNLGLMRALEKFDYRRGFKFSTYATWWIHQKVGRAVKDQARTIRLPVHRHRQVMILRQTQQALRGASGHEPSAAELAGVLGWTESKVLIIMQAALWTVSLEELIGEDEEDERGDFIQDPGALDPAGAADTAELRRLLEQWVSRLPEREAFLVRHYYGLADLPCLTLDEIGVAFGLTREGVRQVLVKLLDHVRRQPAHRRQLQPFLKR